MAWLHSFQDNTFDDAFHWNHIRGSLDPGSPYYDDTLVRRGAQGSSWGRCGCGLGFQTDRCVNPYGSLFVSGSGGLVIFTFRIIS